MASQVPAQRPLGSATLLAATQVCEDWSQVMQVPAQSLLVQQPDCGMQMVVPFAVQDVVEPVHA